VPAVAETEPKGSTPSAARGTAVAETEPKGSTPSAARETA
jgi:hypothetical protein